MNQLADSFAGCGMIPIRRWRERLDSEKYLAVREPVTAPRTSEHLMWQVRDLPIQVGA